jgi:iron complex outermembrane receptor protein
MARRPVWTAGRLAPALIVAAMAGPAFAQQAGGEDAPPIVVVAVTPLPGTSIDVDKIPGEVETLSVRDLIQERRADTLPNLVASQMADVSLNDEQGSPFQPDFVYRGFEASPISGVAEGIAVYQDGVRLNESFGDTVNWDLVPEFAVGSLTVQSGNPVFGLNTMGGAVTMSMKTGLDFRGLDAALSGGSFGNVTGDVEYGARLGDLGVYLGVGGLNDDGFRHDSPTTLRQAYGDLAYQHDRLTLHLSVSGAFNNIGAVGPTPVQLLAHDPKAVFTYPQSMRNQMALVQLRGAYQASNTLSFSANAYYRHFRQDLVDGNTTDVASCANAPSQLCLEGAYDYPGDALYDSQGHTVAASALPAGATPGEIDFTHTNTNAVGAAVQASLSAPVLDHGDSLVLGASVDHGWTQYGAQGELGTLESNLEVVGAGVIIDQGLSPTAQPPIETPVSVAADNTYTGVYGLNVLDLTPRLSWTLSGRLNIAQISLADRLGDSLNSHDTHGRFNPGTGLTYRLTAGLTIHGGYSESNRAPTAGELSCANPASPCLLDAFLVSDPPLKQVVSRTWEGGLRGRWSIGRSAQLSWNASAFRTDAADDILLLATQINGFGYFQNTGGTRRQGVDLNFSYRDPHWTVNASHAYLQATFLSAETLSSNSPAADANGLIQVRPGDTLPMNPASRATLSVDRIVSPAWRLGADLRAQSGQYLVGDESNQEPKLPGFITVGLHTEVQINRRIQLFGEIENLFDARYYTYGTFTDLGGLPPNFNLTNPRAYSPSEGRNFTIGARLSLGG